MRICLSIMAVLVLLKTTSACAQSEEFAIQAMKAYENKNYGACSSLFAQSFVSHSQYFVDDQSMHNNYYNAACCYSLAGQKAEAMKYLNKVVDNPFFWDLKHLQGDEDLIALHGEPEWATMIARAEKAIATRQPMTIASLDMASARKDPPKPPLQVRKANGSGRVVLVVTVGADGFPKKILIEQSSGDGLIDSTAAEAAKRWKYKPGVTKNGVKISGLVRIPIDFVPSKKWLIEFR